MVPGYCLPSHPLQADVVGADFAGGSAPFRNFEPHRVSSRRFFKLRSRDPADCRAILASPWRRLQVTRRLEAVRGPCSTAKL